MAETRAHDAAPDAGRSRDGARAAARRARAQAFVASQRPDSGPFLSVVVPAFDEEHRIAPTLLATVLWLRDRAVPFELIVVDDGSRDDTARVVRELAEAHGEIVLHRLPENRGKGAAVRAGMLRARGAWALFEDADGATPIVELDRLLVAAADGADVVIGSRALAAPDVVVERRAGRHLAGRLFAWLVNRLAVGGVADTQCGFKLFRAQAARSVFSQQRLDRFGFDVEVLFLARRLGLRVAEVAVNWNDVQGSKVSLAAGLDGFLDVLRARWIHRGGR